MENKITLPAEEWEYFEALSSEYKRECSDLTDRDFRNKILFFMFCRMEDCQQKVALFEHLKAEKYIVPEKQKR